MMHYYEMFSGVPHHFDFTWLRAVRGKANAPHCDLPLSIVLP